MVAGSVKFEGDFWIKLAMPIKINGVASLIPLERVSKIPVKILGKANGRQTLRTVCIWLKPNAFAENFK